MAMRMHISCIQEMMGSCKGNGIYRVSARALKRFLFPCGRGEADQETILGIGLGESTALHPIRCGGRLGRLWGKDRRQEQQGIEDSDGNRGASARVGKISERASSSDPLSWVAHLWGGDGPCLSGRFGADYADTEAASIRRLPMCRELIATFQRKNEFGSETYSRGYAT